ncbi:MAG: DUF115 domain-containing protein [Sphaerochaeta sp.]|nr:DUF115 domain-containing protein [Sphaerochaeta sp.]
MSEQRTNELLNKFDDWNRGVIKELLPGWCRNVAKNLEIATTSMDFKQGCARTKHCIVVASGPSLTDDEVMSLKNYSGDIIVCNKVFKRFLDLGVVPDWCLLLDSNAMSEEQFRFLKERTLVQTKFLISTTAFPATVRAIHDHVKGRPNQFYMFNPTVGIEGDMDVTTVWKWMNGCPELSHGGNVGTMAFMFARDRGYEVIGLLGYDLYEELDPKWTVEQAKEREYLYFPDMDEVVAIPFQFLAYSQCLANTALIWHGNDPKGPRKAVNLSESPLMRHINVFQQKKVKEYVEWTDEI